MSAPCTIVVHGIARCAANVHSRLRELGRWSSKGEAPAHWGIEQGFHFLREGNGHTEDLRTGDVVADDLAHSMTSLPSDNDNNFLFLFDIDPQQQPSQKNTACADADMMPEATIPTQQHIAGQTVANIIPTVEWIDIGRVDP